MDSQILKTKGSLHSEQALKEGLIAGRGVPIRIEYTFLEHTAPQRIDSRSWLSLMFSRTKE